MEKQINNKTITSFNSKRFCQVVWFVHTLEGEYLGNFDSYCEAVEYCNKY